MSEFLKGNYLSPKMTSNSGSVPDVKEGEYNEFEKKALERLGGSIAFVMKSKTFLWTPQDEKKDDPKP